MNPLTIGIVKSGSVGPDGNQIDNKDTQHFVDDRLLGVTLPEEGLEDGVYTVTTKMLSQIDGHVTEDAFVFGVGESTPLSSLLEMVKQN